MAKKKAPRNIAPTTSRHGGAQERLDEGLRETFPASDASQETQPGGGITGNEPPPAGQKGAR